ncbi:methyltransferase domain-containing protein [Venturia nashicola]|nr:methyltransferase domain-containing protein [Venturia nashicola]
MAPTQTIIGDGKFDKAAPSDETSVYRNELPLSIKPEARELLVSYSGVDPDEVDAHVLALRDKAFQIRPYPCIGHFRFLTLSLSQSPRYGEILQRLRKGETLLDVGCCFGQELRKLVDDGVPPAQLYGVDLEPIFVNFGYELFRDREKFHATFLFGDMFQHSPDTFESLAGKINVVWASSFLHLFGWEDQLSLCNRIVGFLKRKKGSTILGRQLGSVVPGNFPLQDLMQAEPYWHSPTSFRSLWDEVELATKTKFEVCATLDEEEFRYEDCREWGHPFMRRLLFTATLVGLE